MEVWQLIVSICAGIITIITLLDKLGLLRAVKRVNTDYSELKKMSEQMMVVQQNLVSISNLQIIQSQALLALLRNDLYQCFKLNRDLGAWTDDEANVQNKLHEVYKDLKGNGEESIWWEKKKDWKIVSNEEYRELVNNCRV